MTDPLVEPYRDFGEAARAAYAMMAGVDDVPPAEILQRLLATLLVTEERSSREQPGPGIRQEDTDDRDLVDDESGLATRRTWLRALAAEEDRCQRYGIEAGVVVVHVDGAADTYPPGDNASPLWATRAIVGAVRPHDLVARTEPGTISVLATHRARDELADLAKQITVEIEDAGVMGSVGSAMRDGRRSLHEAWEAAVANAKGGNKRRRRDDAEDRRR